MPITAVMAARIKNIARLQLMDAPVIVKRAIKVFKVFKVLKVFKVFKVLNVLDY